MHASKHFDNIIDLGAKTKDKYKIFHQNIKLLKTFI